MTRERSLGLLPHMLMWRHKFARPEPSRKADSLPTNQLRVTRVHHDGRRHVRG